MALNNMKHLSFFIIVLLFISCKSNQALPTVENVDINKYVGTWYEIARFPNFFEKGLECVTAEYSLLESGKIKVVNKGHKTSDVSKINTAIGTAWVPDKNKTGQLKVRFFWPFSGDYYIIALDSNYQSALVGDPSRKYLWVLNRATTMNDSSYHKLLNIAHQNNFDTTLLMKVNQTCN